MNFDSQYLYKRTVSDKLYFQMCILVHIHVWMKRMLADHHQWLITNNLFQNATYPLEDVWTLIKEFVFTFSGHVASDKIYRPQDTANDTQWGHKIDFLVPSVILI